VITDEVTIAGSTGDFSPDRVGSKGKYSKYGKKFNAEVYIQCS
jgi:hypothetical protein